MEREIRISVGAIIIRGDSILFVKHGAIRHGRNFLVGPGGRVENNESIIQAVTREVKEETGLDISPGKILFIEDLKSSQNRVVKIWFLCHLSGGGLVKTKNALSEGIIEAKWYRKNELKNEVFYPSILANIEWEKLFQDSWDTKYIESTVSDTDL